MLKYTPDEHQEEGIEFCTRSHYCILGDDMGLGKTFQAIATMVLDPKVNGFQCCVPAHLKYNWKLELIKCQSKYKEEDIIVCSDAFDIVGAMRTKGKVIIYNYEMLSKMLLLQKLFQVYPNVVVDEAHYLKNVGATRTMALHNYVEDFKPYRVILLTGTAIKNRVDEFYSLLLLCSHNPLETSGKSILDMNFHHFQNKFMRWRFKKDRWGVTTQYKKWFGLRNKEKLMKLLDGKYLRRDATDIRGVTSTSQFIQLGESIEDPGLKEAWDAFNKGVSVDTKAKVKSATLIAPLTSKYVLDLLPQVGQVVVFSEHRKPGKIISENLRKKGYKVGYIDGDVDPEKRQDMVNDFQEGKLDAMVGTYLAMGTGYTMTSAWNCVTNDWPWVPGDLAQALMRIDRKTQTKHCIHHHMVGGKVTKYIYNQLVEKDKVIKEINNYWRDL